MVVVRQRRLVGSARSQKHKLLLVIVVAFITFIMILLYDTSTGGSSGSNQYDLLKLTHSSIHQSDNNNETTKAMSLSCFQPDLDHTKSIVEDVLQFKKNLSLPIIYVGMPKLGSTSLFVYFACNGYKTNHWKTIQHGYIGTCIQNAIEKQNKQSSPLSSCNSWTPYKTTQWYRTTLNPYERKKYNTNDYTEYNTSSHGAEVYTQLDVELDNGVCIFPQISYLHNIHTEYPNATFILTFRNNINDWINSIMGWGKNKKEKISSNSMQQRLLQCNIPGLPIGIGNTIDEYKQWFCQHVINIRNFIKLYPSQHTLIELNIDDSNNIENILIKLFPTKNNNNDNNNNCWTQSNHKLTIRQRFEIWRILRRIAWTIGILEM